MAIVHRAREEILTMQPYVSARREAGSDGILLNANENPFVAPGYPELPLNRYPPPQPASLVGRMADTYGVPRERILVTRGSDEAIDLLVRAFCRANRDSVVSCPPTFGMYRIAARSQGAGHVEVPLLADRGFAPDMEGLHAALDDDAVRVVFLCSPNNPTGNCMARDAVLEIARAARDRALVVVDEAYLEFTAAGSMAGEIERHDNLAVMRTLSKAYALAGARCGALIARPEVVGLLSRIMAPYPVPEPVRRVAERVLDPRHRAAVKGQIDAIIEQRERLGAELKKMTFVKQVHASEANFVLVAVTNAPALLRAAALAGIVLRDMSGHPGLEDCVRITAGSEGEVTRLLEFLESL